MPISAPTRFPAYHKPESFSFVSISTSLFQKKGKSLSQDILLEAQQLLSPCLPHLPTRVHMQSLLRLNSWRPALCLFTLPWDISSTKPSPLSSPSFIFTSQIPWGHSVVLRAEHENILYTREFISPNALKVSSSSFTESEHHAFV